MLTFDRYLLRSFFHTFVVCFTALFGLYVVIDLLENLDEFIARNEGGGLPQLIERIALYYGYQAILFLDRAGPVLTLLCVVVVLILFQRSGELHPMLAAGIPMRRVLAPLVFVSAVVSGLLVVNQEVVLPRFAYQMLEGRGASSKEAPPVEPTYDHVTWITIDGKAIRPADLTIDQAEFVLPTPGIVEEMTTLRAERAVFHRASKGRRSGWLLYGTQPEYADLPLTIEGEKVIRYEPKRDAVFVATEISPDQLYQRKTSYSMLSTMELIHRIQNPAFGIVSVHRLVLHLHSRFVHPLLTVIAVMLTIPLIVRRESTGLVADAAFCAFVQGLMVCVLQGSQMLGMNHVLPPDLAAWLPVIVGSCLVTLVGGYLRT
ncbi:MAG: LptF/LptG family permease [Planctomycetaceae bacterium]